MKTTMQAMAVAVLGMALAGPVAAYGTKSVSGYGIKVTRDTDNPRLFHVTGTPNVPSGANYVAGMDLICEHSYSVSVPYHLRPFKDTAMVYHFERACTVIINGRYGQSWTVGVVHSGSRPSGQHPTQVQFNIDPNDPFKCEVTYNVAEADFEGYSLDRIFLWIYRSTFHSLHQRHYGPVEILRSDLRATVSCPRFAWDQAYVLSLQVKYSPPPERYAPTPPAHLNDSYETPPVPAAAPPPGEPTAAASCGHVAIVPTMPRALSGGEDAADHWIRISNPSATGITFTVDGRDRAGTKGGTYRRELPAYRSVRVGMRSLEAAFNVSKPAGWWTLTVAGTGPLYAAATMRQGDATRFVPVERPATCTTGAR